MLQAVFWCDRWHVEMLGAKGDCVSNPLTLCRHSDISLCTVPVHRGADAPAFFAPEVPGVARTRFVMRDHFLAQGTKRCGVVIKRSVVKFPRRDTRVERGLAKEVELHDGLRNEEIPEKTREIM